MNNISMTKQNPCFRRWNRKGWSVFASLGRYVRIGVLSAGMSMLLLHAQGLFAQDADSTTVLRTLKIAGVDVAGRQSAPTHNALSQTPLFDRKAEGAAPLQTLEAALRLTPAVDMRERGGKGTQADISIRGGSFDQTMVLLNGIDFTDARTGHQSHSLPVDLECISAVDLIDGLPGVGAYAGAVNIRTAPLARRYLRLDASGGQYGYGYANLSGALSSGGVTVQAAGSMRRSDGYMHNTDFHTYNAFVRATGTSRRAGLFDFQAGYQARDFGSNGFYAGYNPDQWERTSTALASLRWERCLGAHTLGASVSYRKNFDRYDWTRGTAMNRHNTDNVGARLWIERRWARAGATSFGGNYAYNHIFSTNLGDELATPHGDYRRGKSRHTGNIWLRHAVRGRRFDAAVSAGVSLTPYGESALWSLSAGYLPSDAWRLEAGLAQSMRLPTFTDLYYTSPAQVNNLDLRPERAVTARLGASFARSVWRASAVAYYRAGRNIIDWVWHDDEDPDPALRGKWHSEQTSRLDTYGVELSGGYASDEGFLRRATVSYAYVATDRNDGVVAQSAMDFMRHKAALSLEVRMLRRVSLAVTGSLYDRNGSYTFYPVAGDSSQTEIRPYDPYFLLDARLQWERGICRIYLDATNLTDTRYRDLGSVRCPGTWITAGVTITVR